MPKLLTYFLPFAFALSLIPQNGISQTTDNIEKQTGTPPIAEQLDLDKEANGGPTANEPFTKETIGSWEIKCKRLQDGTEPCQMFQLMEDSKGAPVAEISISHLSEGDKAKARATVIVPLESAFKKQLLLSIDGGSPRQYPYSFCTPDGCYVRFELTPADVTKFKNGREAAITIAPAFAPNQEVVLTTFLDGFTAAYDKVISESRKANGAKPEDFVATSAGRSAGKLMGQTDQKQPAAPLQKPEKNANLSLKELAVEFTNNLVGKTAQAGLPLQYDTSTFSRLYGSPEYEGHRQLVTVLEAYGIFQRIEFNGRLIRFKVSDAYNGLVLNTTPDSVWVNLGKYEVIQIISTTERSDSANCDLEVVFRAWFKNDGNEIAKAIDDALPGDGYKQRNCYYLGKNGLEWQYNNIHFD